MVALKRWLGKVAQSSTFEVLAWKAGTSKVLVLAWPRGLVE